ncbi:hypothetical protein BDF20DRAFT_903893 [Mycotypha africana]|uniref:uncharacterized protein n=1 Tax=Mycotypha africana TaxID=64632 RepID=UPI0023005B14|nr:uncharacterized protein BDF20DRAFT_903893 [Mycotypha africana]KAI8990989.1 hypothetical protein BDF20DRAFT_903893 [Mycotypha africana]
MTINLETVIATNSSTENQLETIDLEGGLITTSSQPFRKKSDFSSTDVLICATHGKIYALHKLNAFGGAISLFIEEQNKLFAGAGGKIACLNVLTGDTMWVNRIPGFGTDDVAISSSIRMPVTNDDAIRVSGTTDDEDFETISEIVDGSADEVSPDVNTSKESLETHLVFTGSRGIVLAMNSETGNIVWSYNCPGGYYKTPVIVVEPSNHLSKLHPYQVLYIGAGNWVYCLKARTGGVLWSVKVSSIKSGANYMALAST